MRIALVGPRNSWPRAPTPGLFPARLRTRLEPDRICLVLLENESPGQLAPFRPARSHPHHSPPNPLPATKTPLARLPPLAQPPFLQLRSDITYTGLNSPAIHYLSARAQHKPYFCLTLSLLEHLGAFPNSDPPTQPDPSSSTQLVPFQLVGATTIRACTRVIWRVRVRRSRVFISGINWNGTSVLSQKCAYKRGRRWPGFHQRFWSKRKVWAARWWFRYSGGWLVPVRASSGARPAGFDFRSGRRTRAPPDSARKRWSA